MAVSTNFRRSLVTLAVVIIVLSLISGKIVNSFLPRQNDDISEIAVNFDHTYLPYLSSMKAFTECTTPSVSTLGNTAIQCHFYGRQLERACECGCVETTKCSIGRDSTIAHVQ
eukprot:PhF_6_TR37217/c0_g1_i2/m.54880